MSSAFRPVISAWLLALPLFSPVMAQPVAEAPLADIFAVRSWEPPPAVVAMPVPAVPQAPPLPFRFLGRIVEPMRGPAYLLVDGARVIVVGEGDMIGKSYQLEKYENGRLLFRHRPTNLRQTLDLGEQR